MVRRALAALLSTSLIVLSPGLAPYAAAGQQFGTAASGPAAVNAGPAAAAPSLHLPAFNAPLSSLDNGALGAMTGVALPSAAAPSAAQVPSAASSPAAARAAVLPAAVLPAAASLPGVRAVGASRRSGVSAMTVQVGRTLENVGDLSRAQPAQARETGAALQDIISGGRAAGADAALPAVSASEMGSASGASLSYAKPAGRDSIVDAAEAYFGGTPNVPAPPSNNNGGNGGSFNNGNGGAQGPNKAPLVPRILSALLALAPAALLGWPLIAGGSLLAGALVIAGSAGVAALPFMSQGTPSFLRALPGVVISALGVAAIVGGLSTGGAAVAMGAVVALGGWGFVRFARTGGRKYDSAQDLIAAFFGALGAVTGAGLALLHPAGLVATVLTIAAYPTTLALYMYLPGWVGAALEGAVRGMDVSVRDSHRVLSSVRHDTVLAKRLEAYTSASLKASAWNAVWLGLLVWLPVLLVEGVSSAVGVVAGLALGLVRAPVMLLWGAAYKIAPQSAATRFFAGWARSTYFVNKPSLFNRFEKPLLPFANSDNKAVSVLGALGLRFLQAGYLGAAALWTPLAAALGWIDGLREAGKPYDEKLHNPDDLSLGQDALASQVPEVPEPKATVAWPGKAMAAAIGLSPLLILGAPLWTAGLLGYGALASMAAIGLMPVMPAKSLPAAVHGLPATFLTLTGGFAAFGAARMALFVGLPTGMILPLGVLAVFAGLGLRALIDKLRDGKTQLWKLDEPEYIGGFVSALAISAALGAALLGISGPLALGLNIAAFALSPLLLYHLPRYLWTGVGAALTGLFSPIGKIWGVMGFWRHDSRFNDNLSGWYRYWTNQSGWYAAMFLVPWALTLASYAVESALSLAAGLLVGVTRLPARFAWGWSYEKNYQGRAASFWTGFNRFMSGAVEGSKKTRFDPLVAKLIPAMDEKDAVSSRPTLKAMSALGVARLAQLGWLVYVLGAAVLSPLLWPFAVRAGLRNTQAERPRRDLF